MDSKSRYQSHGDGLWDRDEFKAFGYQTTLESTVKAFYPGQISIGDETYIGHHTLLYGYFLNGHSISIGSRCWIGAQCYLGGHGGLRIEDDVGIGPGVKILTSSHDADGGRQKVMANSIVFASVVLSKGCDVGFGALLLPGARIGRYSIVGAGSVVTKDVPEGAIVAGNPARFMRWREGFGEKGFISDTLRVDNYRA